MSYLLYITADQVGKANHGAGSVTWNESQALSTLGMVAVIDRDQLPDQLIEGGLPPFHYEEPWGWDQKAYEKRDWFVVQPKLAHFYAGTFSKTVEALKRNGCKISYTAAAHSIEISRKAHEELEIPYNYPHLTDPEQWKRYVAGYLKANVLICPSEHSAILMRNYGIPLGLTPRIEVIPHGIDMPKCLECSGVGEFGSDETVNCAMCGGSGIAPIKPLPKKFTVGYLGNISPDKGVVDLLKAWKKLNYQDATLVIAGQDSTSPFCQYLVKTYGGGNIHLAGWQKSLADFYNSLSLYVQPSRTEGFGIEVLEAMSYGRPVICSEGAGACDVLNSFGNYKYPSGNVGVLEYRIENARKNWNLGEEGKINRTLIEENYTWDKIRERYIQVWRSLL